MQLLEHFTKLSLHPKNAEQLKGLILKLAIHGSLTSKWRDRNSNIKPTSEILPKIRRENKWGKLDLNILPEIPSNWEYILTGEVFTATQGVQLPKSEQRSTQLPGLKKYLYISDFKGTGTPKYVEDKYPSKEIGINDLIMINTGATAGQVLSGQEGILSNNLFKLDFPSEITRDYVLLFLKSPMFYGIISKSLKGGANPHMGHKRFYEWPFPFPPIEEQKAIVEVVNQLFKEVEQLEDLTKQRITLKEDFVTSALQRLTQADNTTQEWNFLQEHFSNFFTEKANIKKLRETILQLAVQGKLTAQWRKENPTLEPASELLKHIEAEKQRLIAEKKIRKEKPLPPISEDETPFELPEGWEWISLGEFSTLINGDRGKNYPSRAHYVNSGIPFITAGNLGERFLKHKDLNYIKEERFDLLRSGQITKNDILYCLRGSLGKCAIVDGIDKGAIASSLVIVRVVGCVEQNYLLNYFLSPLGKQMILRHDNGTAQPNLSATDVKSYVVPIPPLEEQKSIVQKVNSLMTLCDELEQQIETSQTQIEQLMQSCLKEVFEN